MLEISKILFDDPVKLAIIAPTMITEDIALVTDIRGVCKDGVTLPTKFFDKPFNAFVTKCCRNFLRAVKPRHFFFQIVS